MVVKTMLFTNKTVDTVNIPLQPIEKIQFNPESSSSSTEINEVDLIEVKQQCEVLLAQAYQEKEILLKEAKDEIEQLKQVTYQEAYDLGYMKGHEQGLITGKQQAKDTTYQYLTELKEHCFKIQAEGEQYIDGIANDLLQLTKNIVEKITFQVIENSTTTILPMIQNQLKEISRRKQIFIRLNPDCYNHVQSQIPQLQQYCPQSQIHLVPDMTLTAYGCVIETESEIIDLQLDKQLNHLFQEFERLVFES